MSNHVKFLTTIATAGIAFSLFASAAAPTLASDGTKDQSAVGSSDWSNADNWSPTQIAQYLSQPDKTVQSESQVAPQEGTEIQHLDQYVTVVNNSFVLTNSAKSQLSAEEYQGLTQQLQKANSVVKSNSSTIDPASKAFDASPYQTRAGNQPSYKSFWWGNRYYFTSNAQIATMVYWIHSVADNNSLLSGFPIIGVLYGWNASRLNHMATDLDRYNDLHINDHVWMDINSYLGTYSFGTF